MSKGFGNLMRQVNQMQKKMAQTQQELNEKTVEGESGQGKVKAIVTGGFEVRKLTIDKELVDPNDTSMLEDLVAVAINDGITKAKKMKDAEMGKLTAGLPVNLPGML